MYNRSKIFKFLSLGLTVLTVSCLIPQIASARTRHSPPSSTNGIGNILNYPYGSRIYQNGAINTPNGNVIIPALRVNNGNGVTTYYYPDGTRASIKNNTIGPSGTYLAPGGLNGGLTNQFNYVVPSLTPPGNHSL